MSNAHPGITWPYVGLLVLLGLVGFLITGQQSVTALIPAFFGVVVLAVAFLASRMKKAAATSVVLIALAAIGLLATVGGIPKLASMMGGGEVDRPAAVVSQSIMAVISLVYGVAVFLALRRSR